MALGQRRTLAARVAVAVAFACGTLGLVAGALGHMWKFGATGWFSGGSLLTLMALFLLIDGALASRSSAGRPAA
jgi:hypothetical protein